MSSRHTPKRWGVKKGHQQKGCKARALQKFKPSVAAAKISVNPLNKTPKFKRKIPNKFTPLCSTVNSEIFARVLFSRNFADAKFRENKPLVKSLCRLLLQVDQAIVENSMNFNVIREIKILSKKFGFTVWVQKILDLLN